MVSLLMTDATGLFDKLGPEGGAHEAKSVLDAFAMLMLYAPGEETITRLAVLYGSEAENARLPAELCKPMLKAVSEKKEFPYDHEEGQNWIRRVAKYMRHQKN